MGVACWPINSSSDSCDWFFVSWCALVPQIWLGAPSEDLAFSKSHRCCSGCLPATPGESWILSSGLAKA